MTAFAPELTNSSEEQAAERPQTALTMEHLLYLLALLVGFAVRFVNLGQTPLSPHEAAQAWPAFLAATGGQVANAPPPASALLYGLQSWLFLVAGGGDTLARLLPALAGTAIVLLPWWWRQWLGRTAALVVAGLLAVDPWLAALSRTGDGAMLAIALGLLALTALWQWLAVPHVGVRTGQKSSVAWERTLAVSLALLLVSGPLAWSWLPVLALFAWLCLRSAPRRSTQTADEQLNPHSNPLSDPVSHQHPLNSLSNPLSATWLWFAAALLLGATGFLAWPGAFGALGTSLTAWLAQWTGGDSGFGPGWPFLRLAVDQPLLLVFGPLGLLFLALGRRQKETSQEPAGLDTSPTSGRPPRHLQRRDALFLCLWAAWGLLLLLLPGRSAFVLPMLGLPLAIAASMLIAWLIELPLVDVGGLEITVLLVVATVLLIAGSIWLALAVESASYDTRLALTVAVLAGLTLAIWLIFGFWAGWQAAAKLAGLFFATVLLLLTVRSTFLLVQPGGRMAPDGLFAVTALPEARLLANDVQRLSSLRFGDPHQAPVQVATGGAAPDPLVGWLLRDMVDLSWVIAPDPAATPPSADGTARPPLIVAPASMAQDTGLGGMIGSEYPLTMRWDPSLLPSLPPADAGGEGLPAEDLARLRAEQAWSQATRPQLEWLLYRTIKTEPPVEGVNLWVTPSE